MLLNETDLKHSLFLSPFYQLAQYRCTENPSKSVFIQLLFKLISPITQLPCFSTSFALMWKRLMQASSILLIVLLSVANTEQIGLAMLLCFGTTLAHTCCVFNNVKEKPQPITFNGLDGLVTIFFISALVSAAFSSYWHTNLEGLFKFFIYYTSYLTFRLQSALLPDTFKHLLKVLIGVGLLQAIIGLYQNFTHIEALATWQDPNQDPLLQMTRVFGTLQPANPNLYAGFLLPILGLTLGFGFKQYFNQHRLKSLLYFGASLVLLTAIILSGSRGAFISLGLMGVTLYALLGHLLWHHAELKHQHKLKILWLGSLVLIGLGGVLVFMGVPSLKARLLSIFALAQDSSNAYRITVWHSVIEMIKDNWLLGIGPGNDTFKQVYGLYMTTGYHALGSYCVFLEIAVEQGLIGLFIFLSLLITLKVQTFRVLFSANSLKNQCSIIAFYTAIVAAIGYGFFDTVWYRPSVNIGFWFLIAGFVTMSYRLLENNIPDEKS